jgi:6-phosphofructokinase 1
MEGDVDGSVSIVRTSDDPYTVDYQRVALEDVAAKTRKMPEEFLVGNNQISPGFRDYALPLVGDLPIRANL